MNDTVKFGSGRRPAAMALHRIVFRRPAPGPRDASIPFGRQSDRTRRICRLLAAALPVLMAALFALAPAGAAGAPEEDPMVRAHQYIVEENYVAASDLLRSVTRKDEAPVEAWMLLGVAYEAQGLSHRAITAYEEVMRRDKNNLDAGLGLGRNLALDRDKLPQAVRLYKSLLKEYPDEPRLHFALGMAYNEMAEVGYAFEQYKAIKDTSPDLAQKLYDAIFLR